MRKLTLAQLQLPVHPVLEDTLKQTEAAVMAASAADFICLPEMFTCPYQVENFPVYAEKEGDRTWTFCADLARRAGSYLSAGSVPEYVEEDGVRRFYNTAYVFDPKGNQIAKHRKAHLFDINVKGGQVFQESLVLSPGDAATTFNTSFGTFGLCICYDFRFPELVRRMVLDGAEVILVPAAFNMTTGPAHWELTFRSQALYHQVFAVGTSPSRDMTASYHAWGHSMVTDPWGRVVAELDEKPGTLITTIDLDEIQAIREQLPLLKHRRPEIY